MKRMHIHLAVDNLQESIDFYSTLFDSLPTVKKEDYAKWDINDPAVNFAISQRGHSAGINHLGIQVDSDAELSDVALRLNNADINISSQKNASCCYVQSDKHWALDPQGIPWESFHSLDSSPFFGNDAKTDLKGAHSACCIPFNRSQDSNQAAVCCIPKTENNSACC